MFCFSNFSHQGLTEFIGFERSGARLSSILELYIYAHHLKCSKFVLMLYGFRLASFVSIYFGNLN